MRTTPASLTTIARAVNDRLAALLETETARWGSFDSDLVAPIREIGRLVLAGEVVRIAPNVPHQAEAMADTCELDVFSPVRTDWVSGW